MLGGRQAELNRAVSERLDGMAHRMNQSMGEATKNTHDNLKRLHERLAVLDAAQQNISDLAGQVTTLTNILANKQSRGAFGQGRMEAIVSDHLPPGAFAFQATLKSRRLAARLPRLHAERRAAARHRREIPAGGL